jgi:hypothetical protein
MQTRKKEPLVPKRPHSFGKEKIVLNIFIHVTFIHVTFIHVTYIPVGVSMWKACPGSIEGAWEVTMKTDRKMDMAIPTAPPPLADHLLLVTITQGLDRLLPTTFKLTLTILWLLLFPKTTAMIPLRLKDIGKTKL